MSPLASRHALSLLAEMANQEHLDILAKGVEAWNAWLRPEFLPVDLRNADLSGRDLRKIRLFSAHLDGANLANADLRFADLRTTSFSDANLRGANLNGAMMMDSNLERANLCDVELIQTNLSDAKLPSANLSNTGLILTNLDRADLRRADFTDARLNGAIVTRTNLRGAVGLESILHIGPVAIDFYTCALSGGLPLRFMRGCGLPQNVIDYLPALLADPVQFHSCFISYSTKDQAFAERLHADLQARGVRCWFAPHDVQAGKKLHEQIDEAIRIYEKLLLILSDASMSSEWVSTEISKARKRERQEKHRMLFPVSLVPFSAVEAWECFDADAGKDSAREIREFFIPDFSNWKDHDSYAKAFERLMRDLKADTSRATSEPR
jgi:uncharacterized protein YjbI with pentapeptide repeats